MLLARCGDTDQLVICVRARRKRVRITSLRLGKRDSDAIGGSSSGTMSLEDSRPFFGAFAHELFRILGCQFLKQDEMMPQTETLFEPIGRITQANRAPGSAPARSNHAVGNAELALWKRCKSVAVNLVYGCKILKQIADSLKEWLGGVEYAFNQVRRMLKTVGQGRLRIRLSRSEAEFLLDKDSPISYHDPKFLSDVLGSATFRLRPLEKSLNWRSCIRTGAALCFGLRVSDALLIEGRKLKG